MPRETFPGNVGGWLAHAVAADPCRRREPPLPQIPRSYLRVRLASQLDPPLDHIDLHVRLPPCTTPNTFGYDPSDPSLALPL
jgi:hypothetical protein